MTTLRIPRNRGRVHAVVLLGLITFAGPAWSYLVQNSTFNFNLDCWTQLDGTQSGGRIQFPEKGEENDDRKPGVF
jgi:hypothetical protein